MTPLRGPAAPATCQKTLNCF